jgi:4-hydroxy-tetrahydrodipicolinate reductase
MAFNFQISDKRNKRIGLFLSEKRKNNIICGNPEGRIPAESIQISSERVGSEPGFHEVTFDSDIDTIKLSHHARSREGFAKGAVDASCWLLKQKPGLYTLDNFVEDLIGDRK